MVKRFQHLINLHTHTHTANEHYIYYIFRAAKRKLPIINTTCGKWVKEILIACKVYISLFMPLGRCVQYISTCDSLICFFFRSFFRFFVLFAVMLDCRRNLITRWNRTIPYHPFHFDLKTARMIQMLNRNQHEILHTKPRAKFKFKWRVFRLM